MARMDDERAELVTLAEVSRRVRLSPQRVGQLALRPDFPERRRIGNAWVVSWPEAERWFRDRELGKGGRPPKQANDGR
jgi:hypothetical protein